MRDYLLDRAMELCNDILEDIDHWDGRDLTVEQLEHLIAAIEYDIRVLIGLLKELSR